MVLTPCRSVGWAVASLLKTCTWRYDARPAREKKDEKARIAANAAAHKSILALTITAFPASLPENRHANSHCAYLTFLTTHHAKRAHHLPNHLLTRRAPPPTNIPYPASYLCRLSAMQFYLYNCSIDRAPWRGLPVFLGSSCAVAVSPHNTGQHGTGVVRMPGWDAYRPRAGRSVYAAGGRVRWCSFAGRHRTAARISATLPPCVLGHLLQCR